MPLDSSAERHCPRTQLCVGKHALQSEPLRPQWTASSAVWQRLLASQQPEQLLGLQGWSQPIAIRLTEPTAKIIHHLRIFTVPLDDIGVPLTVAC